VPRVDATEAQNLKKVKVVKSVPKGALPCKAKTKAHQQYNLPFIYQATQQKCLPVW